MRALLPLTLVVVMTSVQLLPRTSWATPISRRSRRSIVTLRNMVRTVTGIEPLRLLGYANWCGYGGHGPVLDPIDDCCYLHDKCFDAVHEARHCGHLTGYRTPYTWYWQSGSRQVTCHRQQANCQFAFCECDRVFAECLRLRRRHFQPARYPLPTTVTVLYYGTYLCWFVPACWVMGPEFDLMRYAFLVYHVT